MRVPTKQHNAFSLFNVSSSTGLAVYTIPVALEWASWNEKVDRQSSHWTGLLTGMGTFQCIPVPVHIIPVAFQRWFRSLDWNATGIM